MNLARPLPLPSPRSLTFVPNLESSQYFSNFFRSIRLHISEKARSLFLLFYLGLELTTLTLQFHRPFPLLVFLRRTFREIFRVFFNLRNLTGFMLAQWILFTLTRFPCNLEQKDSKGPKIYLIIFIFIGQQEKLF